MCRSKKTRRFEGVLLLINITHTNRRYLIKKEVFDHPVNSVNYYIHVNSLIIMPRRKQSLGVLRPSQTDSDMFSLDNYYTNVIII